MQRPRGLSLHMDNGRGVNIYLCGGARAPESNVELFLKSHSKFFNLLLYFKLVYAVQQAWDKSKTRSISAISFNMVVFDVLSPLVSGEILGTC